MKMELVATGDEIVTGSITDTNSSELASRLTALGHTVNRILAVGDDLDGIVALLTESAERADAVICAGGLGPTTDDLTTEAAAMAAGVDLVLYEDAWEEIKERFAKINLPLSPTNKKQAIMPVGCTVIPNPVGTAPGYYMRIKDTPFFFAPGVPSELFLMFEERILPMLADLDNSPSVYVSRSWRTFGYTESGLGDLLKELADADENLRLSFRANFPEIRVTLTAKGKTDAEAEALLEGPVRIVDEKIGKWVYSRDGRGLPEVVGDLLREKRLKLALAESCTGGLIGKMITDVAGSTDYFAGGVVAYLNEVKMRVLGVPESILKEHGAVSEQCVRAMAEGVRKSLGVDVGVAVTGIAGPAGGTAEKPVGTVHIACSTADGTEARGGAWPRGDREQVRLLTAYAALDLLRKTLSGLLEGTDSTEP